MHIAEFKAWFEGFTELIDGPPNKKQWARIKARVAEIDGVYTPPQVFIDRYWYPYISSTIISVPSYTPTPTNCLAWQVVANNNTEVCLSNFTLAGRAENFSLMGPTGEMGQCGGFDTGAS